MKVNDPRTLYRRELTGRFLTFGLAVPTVVTMAAVPSAAAAPPSGIAANGPGRAVKFRDGTVVPALGQGSARLGRETSGGFWVELARWAKNTTSPRARRTS